MNRLFFVSLLLVLMTVIFCQPGWSSSDERQQLLKNRLDFITQRQQLENEITQLEEQIRIAKNQPLTNASSTYKTSGTRKTRSLESFTLGMVILNFLILTLFMVFRHKSQEPK